MGAEFDHVCSAVERKRKKPETDMKAKRGKAKGGGENAWFSNSLPRKEIYGIMTNGACQNQAVCRENRRESRHLSYWGGF